MSLRGLMTGAGVGSGIKEILAQREAEKLMALKEQAQLADIDQNRIANERNRLQDEWQRKVYETQQARLGQLDQRASDAERRSAITENYAPGDTITAPEDLQDAQRLMPGLVKLRGTQGGPELGATEGGPQMGTLAARPITAPVGPNVGDWTGTAAQRRQAGTDARLSDVAALSEERFAEQQKQNDRMYGLAAARSGQAGTVSPAQRFQMERSLRKDWNALTANWRTMRGQTSIMDAGITAAERGDMAQGAQAVLVTFQKILDPTSVVRESEYARSAEGMSLMNQIEGYADRLRRGGVGVTLPELKKFQQLAREMVARAASSLPATRKQFEDAAVEYGLNPRLIIAEDPEQAAPQAAPSVGTNNDPLGIRK